MLDESAPRHRDRKMSILPSLVKILEPAYGPCAEFGGACKNIMRWCPTSGHVPRGFYGAIGSQFEVELILVVSEPGDPHPGEVHTGLNSAYDYAGKVLCAGQDKYHRNLKQIFDLCWPNEPIERHLRKVWLTTAHSRHKHLRYYVRSWRNLTLGRGRGLPVFCFVGGTTTIRKQ